MPSADQTGGRGGLQPPPVNAPGALAGAAVQPGVSRNVVIANAVIVTGPSGAITGLFEYAAGTTPGKGNPPVNSVTRAATDPYGNPVQQDFASYGAGSSYAQLSDSVLNISTGAAGSVPAQLFPDGTGGLAISSGQVTSLDPPAQILLLSKSANGGTSKQASNAQVVQLTGGAASTIPVSSAGITTVAQVVSALISAGVFS